MRLDYLKKVFVLLAAAFSVTIVSVSRINAQSAPSGSTPVNEDGPALGYLQNISNQATNIFNQINGLQYFFNQLGPFIQAWMDPDTSSSTSTVQQAMATYGTLLESQESFENTGLQPLNQYQLGTTIGLTTTSVPWANDLTFSTVLGQPYWSTDPRGSNVSATQMTQNYIYNVSGMNIVHQIPQPNWKGSAAAQTAYRNYFNTMLSTSSFNAYALSYALNTESQFSPVQQTLINTVTDSQFIAQIDNEEIGKVLRQLLMFQSQSFLLMVEFIKMERMMLASLSMISNVIMTANQQFENNFVTAAQGGTKTP